MEIVNYCGKPAIMKTGHPDNFQTPGVALDALLPHLCAFSHVWEPAAGKGYLVKRLLHEGFAVTQSDIITGWDFLQTDPPPGVDVIVTNPPYSIKNAWIERCYALGLPFAILLPLSALESRSRQRQWSKGLEIVFPPRRIAFETPHDRGSSSWFYTAWFTYGLQIGQPFVFPKEHEE